MIKPVFQLLFLTFGVCNLSNFLFNKIFNFGTVVTCESSALLKNMSLVSCKNYIGETG